MLASLEAALADAVHEPQLVHVVGPGGMGKTALLTVFAEQVAARARVLWLAAGSVPHASPRLAEVLGVPPAELGRGGRVDILLVDACEKDRALLDWLLEAALPGAGAQLLLVSAGREALGTPGPVRAALAPVTRELRLRPLSAEESLEALARRGVPESRRAELAQLAAGLPRALVELAERSRIDRPTPLDERPPNELVDAVAMGIMRDAPTPRHRRAVEALSVALALDQALLAAMLGPLPEEELGALHDWLAGLVFVVRDTRGLVPHPRVRSALERDLGARDPVLRRELGRRAALELTARVDGLGMATRHQLLVEALFARRDAVAAPPGVAALFEGAREERLRRATAKDVEVVRAWLDGSGPTARALGSWWSEQPASLLVLARSGPPTAAACIAAGQTAASGADLVLLAPPEEGDACSAATLGALLGGLLVAVEERPELEGLSVSAPAGLEEFAEALGLVVLARGGLLPSHQRFAFEALPTGTGPARPVEVFRRIALAEGPAPGRPPSLPRSPPLRLATAAPQVGGEAVRAALAARHRPQELRRSPLAALRLVQHRAGPGVAPEQALAAVLDEVCRGLAAAPGYASAARLLEATYLVPGVVKQEAAAAELGLPFGTYRYQLRRALELVTEELAARERSFDGG